MNLHYKLYQNRANELMEKAQNERLANALVAQKREIQPLVNINEEYPDRLNVELRPATNAS